MLGLGWLGRPKSRLDRIELRRIREAPWPWLAGRIEVGSSPLGFELALVDLDENDLAIIGPLTEGEAWDPSGDVMTPMPGYGRLKRVPR